MKGGYARLPGFAKAALADVVGALRPGPDEGLVVGSPDSGADGDAQPRDAHRAQAVDVGFVILLLSILCAGRTLCFFWRGGCFFSGRPYECLRW